MGKAGELQDWQKRVLEERKALDDRIGKLKAFVETETFEALSGDEQSLMVVQGLSMEIYRSSLDSRVKLFYQSSEHRTAG